MYDYEKNSRTSGKANVADDLAIIAGTISRLLPQAKVYLFGSFASGTPHRYSDLDLCIVVPTLERNRFEMMCEIRDAIYNKMEYKYPIDLLLFSASEFEKNAGSKSRVQYEVARKGVLLNA